MVTKKVWESIQKIAILKQLQTHFKAKREKGVGTPFPRVPAPLHPCNHLAILTVSTKFRLSCHDANWREYAESKASNTDALPTHFMIYSRCVWLT